MSPPNKEELTESVQEIEWFLNSVKESQAQEDWPQMVFHVSQLYLLSNGLGKYLSNHIEEVDLILGMERAMEKYEREFSGHTPE